MLCSRILDVSGNVFNLMGIRISDHPLNYFQLVGTAVSGSQGYITVEVRRNNFSDSGPILNACEVYNVREVALGTDVAQGELLGSPNHVHVTLPALFSSYPASTSGSLTFPRTATCTCPSQRPYWLVSRLTSAEVYGPEILAFRCPGLGSVALSTRLHPCESLPVLLEKSEKRQC